MQTSPRVPLVSRRRIVQGIVIGGAALALAPAPSIFAAAARAQSAGDLASLGYPELNVTVTDTGFEDLPPETPAGRYLLTVSSKATNPGAAAVFVSPAALGIGTDELIAMIAPPPADSAPPEGNGPGGEMPLELYQLRFAGGADASYQESGRAVIDLTPGEWVVSGEDGPQQPVALTVTGDYPADVVDPEETITATLLDFAIRLEGNLTAGKHLLKVQNHGAQPHFVVFAKGPERMTKDLLLSSMMGMMSGTPVEGGLGEDELQPFYFSPTQSIGTMTWHEVELEAGTYAAICFFPTAGTGVPHAMNGMIEVFTVAS